MKFLSLFCACVLALTLTTEIAAAESGPASSNPQPAGMAAVRPAEFKNDPSAKTLPKATHGQTIGEPASLTARTDVNRGVWKAPAGMDCNKAGAGGTATATREIALGGPDTATRSRCGTRATGAPPR